VESLPAGRQAAGCTSTSTIINLIFGISNKCLEKETEEVNLTGKQNHALLTGFAQFVEQPLMGVEIA